MAEKEITRRPISPLPKPPFFAVTTKPHANLRRVRKPASLLAPPDGSRRTILSLPSPCPTKRATRNKSRRRRHRTSRLSPKGFVNAVVSPARTSPLRDRALRHAAGGISAEFLRYPARRYRNH